jgi:hypothetical protein
VSTAVYDVGEEEEAAPGEFSGLELEGDVFASPRTPPIVDEVPKVEVEPQEVFEPPPVAPPAMESPAPPEAAPPIAPSPFEEPPGDDEPVIEFVADDSAVDGPPPVADLPPPAERYVDRIVAPSPFAPSGGAGDGGGVVGWTDEDSAAIADLTADIVVDESSDPAIEVPGESIEYDVAPELSETPIEVVDENPFSELVSEPDPESAAIEKAQSQQVSVRAEDNQLQLRLQGTGAVIESGQVRELDIEVPVPGAWVGHRKVTLQLRLTLTPDSEEENGGSGETS